MPSINPQDILAALTDALTAARAVPDDLRRPLFRVLNDPSANDESRIERIAELFSRHYIREVGRRFGGGS